MTPPLKTALPARARPGDFVMRNCRQCEGSGHVLVRNGKALFSIGAIPCDACGGIGLKTVGRVKAA